jgi:thiamine pyrophosphokinase
MKKAIVVASINTSFPNDEKHYFGVDRGALYLSKQGIMMEEAIGDFDTVNEDEMNLISKYSKNIHRLNQIKDETDLEVALSRIINLNFKEIDIYGALGGRVDHLYANLILLNRYINQAKIKLIDLNNEITILNEKKEYELLKNKFKYHSFFAQDEALISLEGFKYDLYHYLLTKNDIITISNEIMSKRAKLTIHSGSLLYIQSKDKY